MRIITLEKLYECIRDEKNEIFVDDNIATNAIKPIQRMLEMS